MTLTEAQFHALVDEVQTRVEDVFDDADSDVDLENAGGVLTVRFENRSQLILSRQPPLRQLWVAARSGGFHFDYDADAGGWVCQGSGELLGTLLSRVAEEQGGEALNFSGI
ncbi:iron donor protein CyaY [Pseudomonas sp. Marseille-QA0892]